MEFLKYPKIYRVGTEETLGILDKPVYIQEKLDGANASIWLGEANTLRCGSRNQEITAGQSFRGLPEFLKDNAAAGIVALLSTYPNIRLYGEWLVKHTIEYKPECYQKFYLFDIYDHNANKFWNPARLLETAEQFNVDVVSTTKDAAVYTLKEIQEKFVGVSNLTAKLNNGEGVVVKSRDGNHFAKIVRPEFKEENAAHFQAHDSEPFYWESWATHSFVTVPRVTKICQSISDCTGTPVTIKDTARVISTVYSDILTEEVRTIAKKVQGGFDFRVFGKLAASRTKDLFFEYLESYSHQDQDCMSIS